MPTSSPLLLLVLDGWGYAEQNSHNAISMAVTPNWDRLWASCPHTLLSASGLDVGLPTGQMGNSEVGHMTLGSGRVIFQDLTLINNSITEGTFEKNTALVNACKLARNQNTALHIMGLLSPGGVHSHEQQIFALIKLAAQQQVSKIYVHAFLDGRDVPPSSAVSSITDLEKVCAKYNAQIASIMGRYYAMDRDKRIERTTAAIELLVNGKAEYSAPNALSGLEKAYARGETDEFVKPTKILDAQIKNNDVVVFMNFRADRARQLSYALTKQLVLGDFVTLTEYDPNIPAHIAFAKPNINNTFGEILQQHNFKQLRLAETEKYAHVTFFFNAGQETKLPDETRILIPSPKVATYDLAPNMAVEEISTHLVNAIRDKTYDVIICNFANADMLGHTGNMAATVHSIQILDKCLGKIMHAIEEFGGEALITADHGNAEVMWDESSKQPHTAHTANLVPLVYLGSRAIKFKQPTETYTPGLKDVAPTMLDLLSLPIPNEMTGTSLLEP